MAHLHDSPELRRVQLPRQKRAYRRGLVSVGPAVWKWGPTVTEASLRALRHPCGQGGRTPRLSVPHDEDGALQGLHAARRALRDG